MEGTRENMRYRAIEEIGRLGYENTGCGVELKILPVASLKFLQINT